MTRTAKSTKLGLIAVAASVLLWACGGGSDGGAMAGMDHGGGAGTTMPDMAAVTCTPTGSSLTVSANNSKFDTDCLAVPAGQAFTISFENTEPVVHNVAILKGHSSTEVLFRGELFRGPKATTYEVPGLSPGTYVFHCETHAGTMKGTFIVV